MMDFEQIFAKYHQRIFRFILSFIHDREDAKDILQDVFVKLWETNENGSTNNIESLLFTISKNKVIDFARKRKVRSRFKESLKIRSGGNLTEQMVIYRETKNKVDEVIESLPEKRKQIFKLNRLEGKSYQEIADHLNISKNTVEVQMVKALKSVRSDLRRMLNK